MAFKYGCPVEVRFRDCDPMGHANNAVYLTYLEVARFAYWRDVCGGRGWGDIKFIMARVEVDYKAPAEQGDMLDVRLGITRTVQVMYDYATGKPVPVLQDFKNRVSAFEGMTS